MAEVKIKAVGNYNGHNIKANKSVDIGFKFGYSEIVNIVKLLQLLNENTTIFVRTGEGKPKKVGMFMIKGIRIDNDGESVVNFNSNVDFIEAPSLDGLAGADLLNIMFKAEIDIKEEEEDDE